MKEVTIIPFYELKIEDKILVLKWRNDINVRQWMYNSSLISEEEHFHFIDSLYLSEEKQYFLVVLDCEKIGVIYFSDISFKNNYCEFGLYSNPNIKGVGSILLENVINYVFNNLKLKRIVAEVFVNNVKAISLYKSKNFKEYKRKVRNNKEIIFMELINDDR